MTTSLCDREEEVVTAVIKGQVNPSIVKHINACESCRAAADMTILFQADKSSAPEEVLDNQSADIIWVQAVFKLRERQKRRNKLSTIIKVISGILVGGFTSGTIFPSNLTFSYDQIESLISNSLSLYLLLVLLITLVFLTISLFIDTVNANSSMT